MKKSGEFLWGRLRTLERDTNRLKDEADRLAECLMTYACDCPEYVRDRCEKKRCGARANDLLTELGYELA